MSIFGKDSFFSICFLLISAATGMGVLTLPWAFKQTGLLLGIIVLLYWSILCSSTIYFLIVGGLHYKVSNMTELIYYSILGEPKIENASIESKSSSAEARKRVEIASKAAVICDLLILFDCLFIIPCLLIFLSDFVIPINVLVQQELPKLSVRYPGLNNSTLAKLFYKIFFHISLFFTERYRCIIFFCIIVLFLCIPNNFSAVRLVSALSVLSSISTATIIIYYGLSSSDQPPECQNGVLVSKANFCREGKIELLNYNSIKEFWKITSVSNIILFSHFCHLILIPTTKNIHHISTIKIKGIVLAFVSTIFIFNCSVGISGYSIFRSNTLPNIISNFAYNDPLIVLVRIYLTLSLTVTICMEIMPLIDSFSSTVRFLSNSVVNLIYKKRSKQTEVMDSIKNVEPNSNITADEETNSNQCTSTLASTVNFTPYFGMNTDRKEESEQAESERKKCPYDVTNFRFMSKEKLFRVFNLIIVLSFSGIMAISFSSVAKLIQLTGGALDGIFVFVIPGWIYYSTYFRCYNRIFGISLLSLYSVNFVVASLSGIVGLFKAE